MSARSATTGPGAVTDRQVADQPGADRETYGRKPDVAQVLLDDLSGDRLLPAQLGVGVQRASQVDEQGLVGPDQGVEPGGYHPAILGRRRHGSQPTRRCHPFGRVGPRQDLPNYIDVTRIRQLPRTDATTEVMALLRDRVPLTLLMDLLDPAGPRSRDILLAELVTDDVRKDAAVLRARTTDFVADQDVC